MPATVVPLCDGGAVVVDDDTLAGALLDPVAAFVRSRLEAGVTALPDLVAAVAAEFDAPPAQIESDLRAGWGQVCILHSTPRRV